MASVIVDLRISAEDYLQYYAGAARSVVARSRDGRRIRFPANLLQRFVDHSGIHGSFEIHFDENGKFRQVRRLG